jgi:hypothetical protein
LEAGDRVVVGAEPVDAFEGREAEDDDAAVGAAGDEDRVGELELADERGMPLQEGEAVAVHGGQATRGTLTSASARAPSSSRPDPDGRVEGTGGDTLAVKGDGIDLVKVAPEDKEALSRVDVPELCARFQALRRKTRATARTRQVAS